MYRVWAWLFFITAGIGAWAAYDHVAALQRLALLAAGLLAVYLIDRLGSINAERTLVVGGIVCAALAIILGALTFVSYDGGKTVIRTDVTAGALIILLPLAGGSVLWLRRRRIRRTAVATGAAVCGALLLLVMTDERSAWFALAIATLAGWGIAQRFALARRRKQVWFWDIVAIGGVASCLAFYILIITIPNLHLWLPLGSRPTVSAHLDTWRNALVLIEDYPFTGSGLDVTAMVFSTYVLLFDVPIYGHVHNLFLQIAVEQGVPGLLAFLGMAATTFYTLAASWRTGSRSEDSLRLAALIALAAMLGHGLLDSELYASWLAPLTFLPFAFASVATRLDQFVIDDIRFRSKQRSGHQVTGGIIGAVAIVAAILLASMPTAQAMLQANLGAVAQTRAELSVYSEPQWLIQDALRRTQIVPLGPAIARYEAALQLDPDNVTALRRIGQIALSRGDYDTARHYLEQAYTRAPQQFVIHLLLGEALVVTGHVEQGAALWKSIDIRPEWLNDRLWWYTHIGATHQAALMTDAIAIVVNQRVTQNDRNDLHSATGQKTR